jgi:pimeloyl-ACP methyl ester carboxylesterase
MGCLVRAAVVVTTLVLALALAAGVTWLYRDKARAALAERYPPPGHMVDVGGFDLHIHCQGEGSPTVVLEAGLAESSLTWDEVQRVVAPLTQVCAYDRAGLGWSERSPSPRSAPHVVKELNALLAGAGVEPPYVLVGHSMGGLFARLYAHEHRDQVVGMVLVDGEHEEWVTRMPASFVQTSREFNEQGKQALRIPQLLSTIGVLAAAPGSYPSMFLNPMPADVEDTHKALLGISTHYFVTAIAESDAEEESRRAIQAAGDTDLGDIPLVVISAGQYAVPDALRLPAEDEERTMAVWHELQAELGALSSNGRQVMAGESGHYIHVDQPQLVIDAIGEVVEAARE